MIHLVFYSMIIYYSISYFTKNNFDKLGIEFIIVVFLGLIANLNKK